MSTPFYDLASLVVVPSGYKASKVYAQKPLTTDGQLTFTRASNATRVNASGLIETVASNVPRLDYLGSSCPRLLLEPQRTNLALYSENFDNAAWTTNATGVTISANTTTAPDGTSSADAILATTTNSGHQVQQRSLSVTSGTAYTISCYLKKNGYRYAAIGVAVNLAAEVVVDFDLGTATGGTLIEMANGWYRLITTATASATGLTRFSIALRDDSNNASFVGDVTKGVYAWGAQLEAGAYATSYIPTLGSTVTRLADACSKTGISSLIGQTQGTLFVDITTTDDITTVTPIGISDGTGSNRVLLYVGAGILNALVTVSGVAQATITSSSISANTRYKMAIAYKANDFVFYVNGVQIGTDTSGTVPSCSKFAYDNGPGSTPFYGLNNQALLFKTRLSNSDLASITSL